MNLKKKISFICFSVLAVLMLMNQMSCAEKVVEGKLSVTPVPSEVKWHNGVFKLNSSTIFTVDAPEIDKSNLTSYLLASTLNIKSSDTEDGDNRIVLKVVPSLDGMTSSEGYRLSVDRKGVKIEALSGAGLFYGVQTLLQMAAESSDIPFIEIKDEPRFQYRGMMLDVSRHFYGKEFVKKQIDLLAYYKINRLHLHLTDAAGWRLEIKKYPRLTEFAAWRPQAVWKEWWNGDRKYCEQSDPRAQGGFYTQDEMRELVEYAAQKYIIIIPEIEMPAHSEEVLTAYPELSCTHVPYKQADFCVGNEKVFELDENGVVKKGEDGKPQMTTNPLYESAQALPEEARAALEGHNQGVRQRQLETARGKVAGTSERAKEAARRQEFRDNDHKYDESSNFNTSADRQARTDYIRSQMAARNQGR